MAKSRLTHLLRGTYSSKRTTSQVRTLLSPYPLSLSAYTPSHCISARFQPSHLTSNFWIIRPFSGFSLWNFFSKFSRNSPSSGEQEENAVSSVNETEVDGSLDSVPPDYDVKLGSGSSLDYVEPKSGDGIIDKNGVGVVASSGEQEEKAVSSVDETEVDGSVDNDALDYDVEWGSGSSLDYAEPKSGDGVIDKNDDGVVASSGGADLDIENLPVVEGQVGRAGNYKGYEHVGSRDPVEIYREFRELPRDAKLCREDWEALHDIFMKFERSFWVSNQALAIYIGASVFPMAARKFMAFFMRGCRDDVAKYLLSLGPGEAEKFLFPIFVEFCLDEFPGEIKSFRRMVESADLTKPHTWFPFARAMKRKIIYHCGPTNSGKTYNALQRFMEAEKGVYCSPLRLLAMEVFDKVNAQGIYCSLLTGQEKKTVPFSNHVACTVEMVSSEELFDVAVIDEIQMMADSSRGFAWTRALLGLKADEIHLCGDPSVLNIVRKICLDTGDELVEQHYDRFKPLVVEAKTLRGDFRNVRSGDCIVAFSRREIFEVKLAIEKQTNHHCCVIYGALPPETRRQQADLFNDPDNEYDVLVATDAVGMGLNLNIRRTIFYTLSKYNGDKIVPVPGSQVKQIAGRAGRRGSRYPDGLTTTFVLEDLDYLIECLKQPFQEVTKVGLFPFFEQVELFAGQMPDTSFAQLLEKFAENCRLDGSFFLCQYSNMKKVANMLEKVQGLSLQDRYNFCFAPVNIRDPKAMHHLLRFASSYSQKLPVNIAMGMPTASARDDSELLDLETKHQVCSTYLWLSNQFEGESFPFKERAETMASGIAELLGESLAKVCWEPETRASNNKGPEQKNSGSGYERRQSLIKKSWKPETSASNKKRLGQKNSGSGYKSPQSLTKISRKPETRASKKKRPEQKNSGSGHERPQSLVELFGK